MLTARLSSQASKNNMRALQKQYTLDECIKANDELEGVMLQDLRACDMIHVRTFNSDYEIFLVDPESGRALVRGGKYFGEPVEGIVSGSALGGCMLKMGWLGVALRMEIYAGGQHLVTSPIQALRVEPVNGEAVNISLDQLVANEEIRQ